MASPLPSQKESILSLSVNGARWVVEVGTYPQNSHLLQSLLLDWLLLGKPQLEMRFEQGSPLWVPLANFLMRYLGSTTWTVVMSYSPMPRVVISRTQ